MHDVLNSIIKKHNLNEFSTNNNNYLTIQKMVNPFSSKTDKIKIIKEFKVRNLPIKGFNQKFKKVKGKYLKLQLFIGIPLLLLSIVLIFQGENYLGKPFNRIQLIILKALIALSISTVGSSLIEGNVETNLTLQKGLTIRAIGWVAVFLLINLFFKSSKSRIRVLNNHLQHAYITSKTTRIPIFKHTKNESTLSLCRSS